MIARIRALGQLAAVAIVLCVTVAIVGAEAPIPPTPTAWVTDTAAMLSPQTVDELNLRLGAYQRSSGHQILVYVAPSTGGAPLEDWTNRAFARWKVGRKGLDDGLVLFLFSRDRTIRIEVGYGFEATVPDVLASRIIRETIEPQLRAGLPDRAVTLGVDQILRLTGGETSGAADAQSSRPLTPTELVFIGLFILVLLVLAIRSPWTALFLLVNIFGGRSGGSYEGGFSGGGGRSGGGGASGRW